MARAQIDVEQSFKTKFCLNPEFYVEAPGRLNIIGEHTDHQNFDVLPFCIEQKISVCCGVSPDSKNFMEIQHVSNKYETGKYDNLKDVSIDQTSGNWCNYVLCALLGVLEYMQNGKEEDVGKLINSRNKEKLAIFENQKVLKPGIKFLITGNIPVAAGLSSSSALVVACLRAMNLMADMPEMSYNQLARIAIAAERHCGTASGGMDQTIICLGQEDVAMQIKFAPMVTQPVELPSCIGFVVCNTMCPSAKAETAYMRYNMRVLELRVGCLLLCELINAAGYKSKKPLGDLPVLKTVMECYDLSFDQLSEFIEKLHDGYSKQEVLDFMKMDVLEELEQYCGKMVLEQNTEFMMKQRLRHVISEQLRVTEFKKCCEQAQAANWDVQKVVMTLGPLIDASMTSLAGDFNCSIQVLDELVGLARKSDHCAGARLTGAGWGGAILVMVEAGTEEKFMDSMFEQFYKPRIEAKEISWPLDMPVTREILSGNLFSTKASCGVRSKKFTYSN